MSNHNTGNDSMGGSSKSNNGNEHNYGTNASEEDDDNASNSHRGNESEDAAVAVDGAGTSPQLVVSVGSSNAPWFACVMFDHSAACCSTSHYPVQSV